MPKNHLAQNAEKLAPCGSTLANESFNNSVASKAPTACHYSGSESLDFRVKAAACQKNSGHSYVSELGQQRKLSIARNCHQSTWDRTE